LIVLLVVPCLALADDEFDEQAQLVQRLGGVYFVPYEDLEDAVLLLLKTPSM
jgi:hypothetical protein